MIIIWIMNLNPIMKYMKSLPEQKKWQPFAQLLLANENECF